MALGLALLRIRIRGKLQVVVTSKPLAGVQHQLHAVPGRSKEDNIITEAHGTHEDPSHPTTNPQSP